MLRTITRFIGFMPYYETDHTEQDMARITAMVVYDALDDDGLEAEYITTLRPGENNAWSKKVIAAAQAWRDTGGVIPEWFPPTPEELREFMEPLTRSQFRRGLLKADEVLPGKPKYRSSDIEEVIAQITDDDAREEATIQWEDTTQFRRLDPLVVTLSTALGLTPEEVDTLWEKALTL